MSQSRSHMSPVQNLISSLRPAMASMKTDEICKHIAIIERISEIGRREAGITGYENHSHKCAVCHFEWTHTGEKGNLDLHTCEKCGYHRFSTTQSMIPPSFTIYYDLLCDEKIARGIICHVL